MGYKMKAVNIFLILIILLIIPISFAADSDASIAEIQDADNILSVNISGNNSTLDTAPIVNNSNNFNNSDNSSLSISYDIYGGDVEQIKTIVKNAKDGDTINLYGNFFANTKGSNIVINKVLNIVGHNCIINGNFYSVTNAFFDVRTMNVNISNIIFKNFGDVKGNKKACVIRVGQTEMFNQAKFCIIENCTFINSFANDGIVTFYSKYGIINNSRFYNNSAYDDGGAIDINVGYTTVDNCVFINNTAGIRKYINYAYGGAISCADNDPEGNGLRECKILNSYFENCTTTNNAGAIRFGSMNGTIDNCTFYKCSAPNEGGAIYLLASNPLWKVSCYENMTVTNIRCYECYAKNGSAIYVYGNKTKIDNAKIFNNTEVNGAIYVMGSNATLESIELYNNKASSTGAGVYIIGEHTTLNNITGYSNVAEDAGVVYIYGFYTQVTNSRFYNNTASNDAGAILLKYSQYSSVSNCSFENNTAGHSGGAVEFWNPYESNSNLTDCIFINNKNYYIPVDDDHYNYDAAGGGLFIYSDWTYIDNCTFIDNEAYVGAAFSLAGFNNTVTNCKFLNNTVYDNTTYGGLGAGVFLSGHDNIFINSIFMNNIGVNGTAVFVSGNNVIFVNCTVFNNTASDTGAGFHVSGNNVRFETINASYNSANNAGVIYVNGNNATFFNILAYLNNATEYGGAILVSGIQSVFDHMNLTFNNAFAGGAVAVIGNVKSSEDAIQFIDGYINYNDAYLGGAIFINASYTVFKDMDYYYNTAHFGGAAVIIGDYTDIDYSDFMYNTAIPSNDTHFGVDGLGGAIVIQGNNVTIHKDTIFNMNKARNGSAIYILGSAKIENTTFEQNQAWVYELHIATDPSGTVVYNTTDHIVVSILLIGGNNIANAIYNANDTTQIINGSVYDNSIEFINVRYGYYINGTETIHVTGDNEHWAIIGAENSKEGNILYQDDRENNQNVDILAVAYDAETGNYTIVFNSSTVSPVKTDIYGNISYTINKTFEPGYVYFTAVHNEDNYYTSTYNYTLVDFIPITDLVLNKTGELNNGVVYWNVTICNYGPQNDTDVYVNESAFKGNIFNIDTHGKGVFNTSTLIWEVGHLSVGEVATLTFSSILENEDGTFNVGSLFNYAIVKGRGNDTNLSNNFDSVQLDWNLTKKVNKMNPNFNETVTYSLNVTNVGNGTVKNVKLVDEVPKGLVVDENTLVDTVWYSVSFDEINNVITWTIYELDIGSSISIDYNVTANAYGILTNNATVYNKKSNQTIKVPNVTLGKDVYDYTPNFGDIINYRINVDNRDSIDANNVTLVDYIPEGLEVIKSSISFDGIYDEIHKTITWIFNIKSGRTNVYTYSCIVKGYGEIINNATIGNHTSSISINVPYIIILNKTTPKDTYNFGDIVEYTVNIQNNCTGAADKVVVYDVLPEGLDLDTTTMNPMGEYNATTRTIKWTINLKSGEIKTFTYNCTANHIAYLTNVVIVGNDTKNKTIYVPYCDVAINITTPEKVTLGDEFDIVVDVTNYGPNVAENVTAILNINGVDINILNVTSTNGTNYTKGTWLIGDLPVGTIVTLVFHVKALTEGTLLITGIVNTNSYDINLLNNIDNATVIIEDTNQSNPVTPDYTINMLPTGNPLLVLLLVLLLTPFIRLKFKK